MPTPVIAGLVFADLKTAVMTRLVRVIHVFLSCLSCHQDVDGPHKAGHDGFG